MKKILFAITMTILLTSSCFASVFNDISGHWAEASILDVYYNGLVNGYSDGTFKPGNTITRAEFITILSNFLSSTIEIEIDESESVYHYSDLPDSHWCVPAYNKIMYYGYVFSDELSTNKQKGKEFITPILGNSFNPSEPITRGEAVSLIAYFLNKDILTEDNTPHFIDISDSELYDYINDFRKTGIIKGYSDGTFKPNNTITRAEVTTIISNLIKQKFYFMQTEWFNEDSIENVYTYNFMPEEIFMKVIRYEAYEQYYNSYQFFSPDYKLNNKILNYKDYMKTPSSHIVSKLPTNIAEGTMLDYKETGKNSCTVYFKDTNKKKHSIDFILVGDKWYIDSALY